MNTLDPIVSRHILERVGGPGEPPEYGFQFFTVGLDAYLSVIEEEYLSSFIKQGGSTFKMVVGIYGGGKTHFLYCIRDLAWHLNFMTSYVKLKSKESPFHSLDKVYQALAGGLTLPLTPTELLTGNDQGIDNVLRSWYSQKFEEFSSQGLAGNGLQEELIDYIDRLNGIQSDSFANAIKAAFKALVNNQPEEFRSICQWLKGEGYDSRIHKQYGILQKIDKSTAFIMVRSLAQWVREIGYSGLVILLDEAERVPSFSTSQREQLLSNLREIIDECGHANFQRVMLFYAVPDETFLDGRTQVYEALKQRLATVFDDVLNPTGVKIELEKTVSEPIPFLHDVGKKLAHIYETAYTHKFDPADLNTTIETIAEAAYANRYFDIGYKRFFVQKLIQGFNFLRRKEVPPTVSDLQM